MEDGLSISLEGLDALLERLSNIEKPEAAIRKALRNGGNIVNAAIVERAPEKDGTGGTLPEGALKHDIITRVSKQKDGEFTVTIGPDKLTAHVARWVEYGHRQVVGGRSALQADGTTTGPGKQVYVRPGQSTIGTGSVPAHSFIRLAWEAVHTEATEAIVTTLVNEINKQSKGKI
jgi:HK97 gp10 family phage protein